MNFNKKKQFITVFDSFESDKSLDPIIEIVSKNIYNSNKYSVKLKTEYISTINRINTSKIIINQYIRSMDYIMAYNTIHEEILYLNRQLEYFKIYFEPNICNFIDDYLNYIITQYNHQLILF